MDEPARRGFIHRSEWPTTTNLIDVRRGRLIPCWTGPAASRIPKAQLTRTPKGFVVLAPFSSLGNPTHVLGSVRTYADKVPLDWIAWRIVEVPGRAYSGTLLR